MMRCRPYVPVLLLCLTLGLARPLCAESAASIAITPGTVTYVENQVSIQVAQLGVSVTDGSGSIDTGTLSVTNGSPTALDFLTIEAYTIPDSGTSPTIIPGRSIVVVDSGIDYTYGISTMNMGTQTITRVTKRIGYLVGGDGANPLVITFNGNAEQVRQSSQPIIRDLISATRFRVTGDNPLGSRAVSFQASSATGLASSLTGATATVVIGPVNDAPSISDVSLSGPAGQTMSAIGTLVDPDNAILTMTITGATHGTVTITDRGTPARTIILAKGASGSVNLAVVSGFTVSYLPENGFTGTDTAAVVVTDGFLTDPATITFTVTTAPAISRDLMTTEGVTVAGSLPALIDGLVATYTINSGPSLGLLDIQAVAGSVHPFFYVTNQSVVNAATNGLAIDTIQLSASLPSGVVVPVTVTVSVTVAAVLEGRPSFRRTPDQEVVAVGGTLSNELVIDGGYVAPRVDYLLMTSIPGASVVQQTGRTGRLLFTPTAAGVYRIPISVSDPATKKCDVRIYVIVVVPTPASAS